MHLGKNKVRTSKYNIVYRVYENKNPIQDEQENFIIANFFKNINWKNLFVMRMTDLMFIICVVFLLVGFSQMNTQCNNYLSDPCSYAAKTNMCIVINNTYYDSSTSAQQNFAFDVPNRSLP